MKSGRTTGYNYNNCAMKKFDKFSAIFPRIACRMFSENYLALYALCPEK